MLLLSCHNSSFDNARLFWMMKTFFWSKFLFENSLHEFNQTSLNTLLFLLKLNKINDSSLTRKKIHQQKPCSIILSLSQLYTDIKSGLNSEKGVLLPLSHFDIDFFYKIWVNRHRGAFNRQYNKLSEKPNYPSKMNN